MNPMGAIVFLPRESGNQPPRLFEDILFAPGAVWLAQALADMGVTRVFAVCHGDDREKAAGYFPAGTEFVTVDAQDANQRLTGFLTSLGGRVTVITQAVLLTPGDHGPLVSSAPEPPQVDSGVWDLDSVALLSALKEGGELESALRTHGAPAETGTVFGIGATPESRAPLDLLAQQYAVTRLRRMGVRSIDPHAVYVDPTVTVGEGTVLLPGTILRGRTAIGKGCVLGPNTMIRDCVIGDGVTVNASQLNESTVDDGATIGPFAYIRPHCRVGKGVKVGDFVELKNSVIGDRTKISHLTYVGDSDVGTGVNFGCGTVTVNYDGSAKYRTVIGDNAFIGCNSNLVAPVKIGEGAYTAAGSTITDDVPADSLAIARAPQTIKVQWAAKRRRATGKK